MRGPLSSLAVTPADLRAQAESLRPAESAALSSKVAYAVWLEEMGLKDEARVYWRVASTERIGDVRLRELAEQ